ncbi:hypothetical protein PAMA_020394 [Pampus argenteus]
MVWLSMDRFLLIKHPTRTHFLLRPKTALIVTGLTWLAVNVEVTPMIVLMVHDLQRENNSRCKDFASLVGGINVSGYSLGLTVTGYILPLFGLCVFSHQIAHLLRAHERALQRRTTFKRPLKVVTSAAVMFLLLYTPYHVMRNVRIASQHWVGLHTCTMMYIEGLYILTRPLAFLHSVINPVFYFLMGDKFRELLMAKLRKLTTSNYYSYGMVINCTEVNDVLEKYYLSPFYGIEFCVGFPGNLLAVLGYIFCLTKWQSCNIYLFNLAVSDLIFLCTLPRLSYLYANHQRETSPFACIINRYVLHVNLYSSILFMVWLSMDRFLLIKHPTRTHFLLRPKTALIVTGLTWLAVNVEVTPMIVLMVHDLQRENNSRCKDFASLVGGINVSGYSLGLTLTGYILPLLGLCVFSHQIAHLLRAHERALQRRTTFKRPLKVVTSAAVMFLLLYTPYHVMRNVRIASQHWVGLHTCTMMYIEGLYILTRPLAFLHSVINPVFYFLMGDKFRELLMTKLRKLVRRE